PALNSDQRSISSWPSHLSWLVLSLATDRKKKSRLKKGKKKKRNEESASYSGARATRDGREDRRPNQMGLRFQRIVAPPRGMTPIETMCVATLLQVLRA